MSVRLATIADLPAIVDIYNYEVVHSDSTFDTEPVTVAAYSDWLRAHEPDRYPVLVVDTKPGEAVGWGSLSPWSAMRCAYRRAAEVSVYVHRDHRGKGVGRGLLTGLIDRARTAELGVLIARICTRSTDSLGLHRALGFGTIGTMRRVGEKFGRILDVELLDLHLDED